MIERFDSPVVYGTKLDGEINVTGWKYWKFYINNNGFGKVYAISEYRDIEVVADAEKAYRRLNGKFKWLWNTKLGRLLVLI